MSFVVVVFLSISIKAISIARARAAGAVQLLQLSVDPNNNINNWWVSAAVILVATFFHLLFLFLFLFLLLIKKGTTAFTFTFTSSSSHSLSSSTSSSSTSAMPSLPSSSLSCAVCGSPAPKKCSACKQLNYCSQACQSQHWKLGHKTKCKELKALAKRSDAAALVSSKTHKLVDKVLFPYDEFLKLFCWDKEVFPPCGLLNCGNSCYANVVLQCLAHTRPLLAYLLDKGHRRDCKRNQWCFLCELEVHITRASRSPQSFSPVNILSRLPSIGSNLGYGKQEDAHEFMRYAIDTMQSTCLDEHGGEKCIHPRAQETTLIQHIFGGQLQSQVTCTQCQRVSNQRENMMDLTVEIHGDATSLEECLVQFTAEEWLHGENMYKCDGCNDYVRAQKRLTVHQAPNVLTVALKRFKSGRFGKINKKIHFPERLNLSPYMSNIRGGADKYKLYGVVVHVDMLNASYFGHYICYMKGFQGDWYRIDDCKVTRVELDEVLSQGAYMLLYSRVSPRPTCLKSFEDSNNQEQEANRASIITEPEHIQQVHSASSSHCSVPRADLPSPNHEQLDQIIDQNTYESVAVVEDSRTSNPASDVPVSVEDHENEVEPPDTLIGNVGDACGEPSCSPTCSNEQSSSVPIQAGLSIEQTSAEVPTLAGLSTLGSGAPIDALFNPMSICETNGTNNVNPKRKREVMGVPADESFVESESSDVVKSASCMLASADDACVGILQHSNGHAIATEEDHSYPYKDKCATFPDMDVKWNELSLSGTCSNVHRRA